MAQLPESERRRILAESQRIAASQPASQRQTQMISESYSDLHEEAGYEASPLQGSLHPSRWKALADRRTVWPSTMDPQMVLKELSSLLAHRVLDTQAAAMGRTVGQAFGIGPHDEI